MRHVWVLLVALVPATAWAWDAEVHYAWTFYVAIHAGFTERQAYQIASAAQAVSDDPDTRIRATTWEQVAEADPEKADSPTRKTLRDLHCFSPWTTDPPANALESLGWVRITGTDADRVPQSAESRLWRTAVETGNPGVVVHYVQDCVAHRDFDDRFGHAAAGHFPDWIATDADKAFQMTSETARVLVKWQRDVLKKSPPAIDKERLLTVLSQIADVNHVDLSGIIAAEGPENPVKWLVDGMRGASVADGFDRRWALELEAPKKFDVGQPSADAAIPILAAAIHEDKVLGRLPAFPDEGWEVPQMSWLAYDIDADQKPDPDGPTWALEQVGLDLPGEAAFARVTPPAQDSDDRLYTIQLRRPYRLVGVADLPPQGGVPVRESCEISDTGEKVVWTTFRGNGEHAISATIQRSATQLREGLKWTCTVWVHGVRSETAILEVPPVAAPYEASVDAGPVATQLAEMEALRAEAWLAASRVGSACGTIGAVREAAEHDVRRITDRLGRYETAMADAGKRCDEVPGALDTARSDLAEAEGSRYAVREKQKAFEAASAATCAAYDAYKKAPDPAGLAAVETKATATTAARAEVDTAVGTVTGRADHVAALRDGLADLQREGRRLYDAVTSLEPSLGVLESSLDDARTRLLGRADDGTRLGELSAKAVEVAASADGAFKAAGKPGKSKPALARIAALRDEITALAGRSSCVADEARALDATGDAVTALIVRNGELAAARALLDKRLPTDDTVYGLDTLHLQAEVITTTMTLLEPGLIMTSDRAATCLGDARAVGP